MCPARSIPLHLIHTHTHYTFNFVLPLHHPTTTRETERILCIGMNFINLGWLDRQLLLLSDGNGFESSSNPVIFSSSYVQATLRLGYIYGKLSANLRHPASLRLG